MLQAHALPDDRKLSFIYRIEPGCLGPEGSALVDGFCDFAQQKMDQTPSDFVLWRVTPRLDKSLPEMQYTLMGKTLSSGQAQKYLALFEQDLDTFEMNMGQHVAQLIDLYLER